jgi:phospholipid-translocating ATPase
MCKGADSVIEERLCSTSKNSQMFMKTQNDVDKYASEGLRTLYLAERYLEENEFNIWFEKSRQAKLSLTNREEEVAKIDELIEVNLELIGSTAIEDRL